MTDFDINLYLDSLSEEINISYKDINFIPDSISRFKNLKILYCEGNILSFYLY